MMNQFFKPQLLVLLIIVVLSSLAMGAEVTTNPPTVSSTPQEASMPMMDPKMMDGKMMDGKMMDGKMNSSMAGYDANMQMKNSTTAKDGGMKEAGSKDMNMNMNMGMNATTKATGNNLQATNSTKSPAPAYAKSASPEQIGHSRTVSCLAGLVSLYVTSLVIDGLA